MKKSSLKNYIAFSMRQHELKDRELLKAKDEIAELKRRLDDSVNRNLGVKLTAKASDHWMRQHELKDRELLKAKDEIAELKRRLERQWRALHSEVETRARLQEDNERLREDNERLSAISILFSMSQHELKDKDKELLKAKDEIAELRRRLDDNGGLCTLRAKLTGETCEEKNDRLREDNERLSRLLRLHRTQPSFGRDHNDTQA